MFSDLTGYNIIYPVFLLLSEYMRIMSDICPDLWRNRKMEKCFLCNKEFL